MMHGNLAYNLNSEKEKTNGRPPIPFVIFRGKEQPMLKPCEAKQIGCGLATTPL